MHVLLVNPPIYDFTAFDFWLRPYGMLRVAGYIQHACRLDFFNFLIPKKRDKWGRGRYDSQDLPRPVCLQDVPRRFRRFGRPREEFCRHLRERAYDAVLIQTSMTYWYPGVREVIEDIRTFQPAAKIILGGIYATLCPSHARSLGPDLVIEGSVLEPLWQLLSIEPQEGAPCLFPESVDPGILKITEGCPFRCTYCSAGLFWPGFSLRPTQDCINELRALCRAGTKNVAFYDDALLFQADKGLTPFLEQVRQEGIRVSFHTPNALNARFITPELARQMVQSGFASFFLGLESNSPNWQSATGAKVHPQESENAVKALQEAGAESITTYIIAGHPDSDVQDPEFSIRFAHACGSKVLLSEFSPIPGTPDAMKCGPWADLPEPLSHNKTAFAIRRLGVESLNHLKTLVHDLNRRLF